MQPAVADTAAAPAAPPETTPETATQGSVLLSVGAPYYEHDGTLYVELQSRNGMRLWAQHFDRVTALAQKRSAPPPAGWIPWGGHDDWQARIRFEWMPEAWSLPRFASVLSETRQRLAALIGGHDYLVFSIGGLIGDWGSMGALVAARLGRPYAVFPDRVESDVAMHRARSTPLGLRRLARMTEAWLMRGYERMVIRKSALGLFHGAATYEVYAPLCPTAFIVHDSHVAPGSLATDAAVEAKAAAIAGADRLKIVYAGRAAPMKGGPDWVAALVKLDAAGVPFEASWLGDGDDLPAMKAAAEAGGIADRITFPGFVEDRDRVLAALSAGHLLVFCHKTLESPRILIEALMCATPIAGYSDAYAEDIAGTGGAGRLSPRNDIDALAATVAALWRDRPALAAMVRAARDRGGAFTDEAVFRHRSDLVKRHLPGPGAPSGDGHG